MQAVPSRADFSVVAIIAAYNEADVIGQVVGDLIEQGVQVYLLDDGSTDGTVAAVEPYRERGVLEIERLAGGDAARPFDWERILKRKAELAHELDADWFIHHDADEFRESPWTGVDLRAGIARVDRLGYNAIDFELLNFWPTHDHFRPGDDPREAFRLYQRGDAFDRPQVRCWKKVDALVDLASTGGHDVAFPGRRVFPLCFLLRHYPIRGQAHGERKVFRERRDRFVAGERERGWHVQYDAVREGTSFLRDPATLTPYDPDEVRLMLALRHRTVDELEDRLGESRRELERLNGERNSLGDELQRVTGERGRLRDELERMASERDQLRDELQRVSGQCAQLGDDLQRRTDELVRARVQLDARGAEAERLRNDLDKRGVEIADLQRELDRRAVELERMRDAYEDRARRLEAVYRSLSWRWTAPARAVGRRFVRGSR